MTRRQSQKRVLAVRACFDSLTAAHGGREAGAPLAFLEGLKHEAGWTAFLRADRRHDQCAVHDAHGGHRGSPPARLLNTGQIVLLDRPLFEYGALAIEIGELFGDQMKSAPDRTVALRLIARISSAGIAGAALAPRGRQQAGAVAAVATAVPLAYLTLAGRERAMARIGQTRSGLIVAAGLTVVALGVRPLRGP